MLHFQKRRTAGAWYEEESVLRGAILEFRFRRKIPHKDCDCGSNHRRKHVRRFLSVPWIRDVAMEIDSSKEIKKKLKKLSKYAKEEALNKDYGDIAGTYMQHAKYHVGKDILDADGKLVKKSKKCVMCKSNPCTHVLFPCRHACVCEPCRKEHCIGTKDSNL